MMTRGFPPQKRLCVYNEQYATVGHAAQILKKYEKQATYLSWSKDFISVLSAVKPRQDLVPLSSSSIVNFMTKILEKILRILKNRTIEINRNSVISDARTQIMNSNTLILSSET